MYYPIVKVLNVYGSRFAFALGTLVRPAREGRTLALRSECQIDQASLHRLNALSTT